VRKLIEAGIDVKIGIEEEASLFLNRRFITSMIEQRPYVILKWAQSANGYIDHVRSEENPNPAGISSEESLKLSHQWRADEAAIMVGTNTVLADNPRLTVRHVTGSNPVRVTFDRRGRIPTSAAILDGSAPTIVFNAEKNYTTEWAEFVCIDFEENPLSQALAELHERRLQSVLVEGGAAILKQFIETGLWDEARVFYAAKEISQGVPAPAFPFAATESLESGSDNVKIFYRNKQ
jgi:diaminohydroxyphosphoribosylaminopyrimidine deaminase/5-amino-6-(5-phosphoribosylamino)uracil reductase